MPHMTGSFCQPNKVSWLLEGQRLQMTLGSHAAALCVFELYEVSTGNAEEVDSKFICLLELDTADDNVWHKATAGIRLTAQI